MIYLDNAATTRPLQKAVEGAQKALGELYFNPSALYAGGLEAHRQIERARQDVLSLVADPDNFDLIFTSCGTEADNQALFSSVKRGNLVISAGEHAAVYEAAKELKNRGVELRIAPLKRDGSVNEEALLALVDDATALVGVIHAGNETGAINPIFSLAEKVKQKNSRTLFFSDGVQAFGKIPVRLTKNIDFYTISAHKIGGLKGTGALLVRKGVRLSPYIWGGGQEGNRRSGTENVFGILTFALAAKEKFKSLSEDAERILALRERLFEQLNQELFVRISPENGTPYILTVAAKNLRGETLLRMCSDQGLYLGTGSACSSKKPFSRVIEACGVGKELLNGVLRLSFSSETTQEEIDGAAAILNGAALQLYGRVS